MNWGRRIVVDRADGATFALSSFDYAAGQWGEAGDATVTGYLANGSTQTSTISFNGRTAQTLALNWSNLARVDVNFAGGVNHAYGSVDNFVFPSGAAAFSDTPIA